MYLTLSHQDLDNFSRGEKNICTYNRSLTYFSFPPEFIIIFLLSYLFLVSYSSNVSTFFFLHIVSHGFLFLANKQRRHTLTFKIKKMVNQTLHGILGWIALDD